MGTTHVPESLPLFGGYIVNADDRLQANNPASGNTFAVDFGLSGPQQTAITGYRTNWLANYATQITLPNCPPDVKRNAHSFRNTVADYFKDEKIIEQIIASKKATATDEMIFHFKQDHADPTHHTVAIADDCYGFVTSAGLGAFDIYCRTRNDHSRASVPVAHGANCIQYAYKIFDGQQPPAAAPLHPEKDGWIVDTSSHAHFNLDVGGANQSKWMVIYFRWYNTKHPNLAGGWSGMYQKVVGG